MKQSKFLIAATSSGCGKTTVALGLMRSLGRKGLSVQPFKCGPDYIDTRFHTVATGNVSVNLDTYMSSAEHADYLFRKNSAGKDIAVVEGVMGLFDGYSKMAGSSALLAELLSIPVVLVVNAASTAYSVAATLFGFKNFNPRLRMAGVIFNRVASESHYSFLKDACKDADIECLGYLKRDKSLSTPSRHLGLTLTAREEMEQFIDSAADAVEMNVDIPRLLKLTAVEEDGAEAKETDAGCNRTAAVAFDDAFNFIYPANLRRLENQGYRIEFFSPIHDSHLPPADFVYIPGGYPELFKEEISSNREMMDSIRTYVESGGLLWAECGGLIYLCQDIDGIKMCGIMPLHCTMDNSRLRLGYRTVNFGNTSFRGHEFHYSSISNPDEIPSVASQKNAGGKPVDTPVYRHKNAFASYTHLYWADNDIFKIWQQ